MQCLCSINAHQSPNYNKKITFSVLRKANTSQTSNQFQNSFPAQLGAGEETTHGKPLKLDGFGLSFSQHLSPGQNKVWSCEPYSLLPAPEGGKWLNSSLYSIASSTLALQQLSWWPQVLFFGYKLDLTVCNSLASVKDSCTVDYFS